MIKILWLCNICFSDSKIKTTASWLQPMAEFLQNNPEIQIYNITLGNVSVPQKSDYSGIIQWVIPRTKLFHHGQVSSHRIYTMISTIESEIKPDLVHIWGTENIWCDAYSKGYIKSKTLLDIQGLLALYYYYYYGGLTTKDILKCIYLKEMLMPWRNLFYKKSVFKLRGIIETECIKNFSYISCQSNWVNNYISFINPNAILFSTNIILRKKFYTADAWQYKNSSSPIIFTTASGAIPYKGIHIALKVIQILKEKYPKIQLRIAGQMKIGNHLVDGYSIYIHKLIKSYQIEENITLLGPIDEIQIVQELQKCNACIIPSFVETYCLAFAEAMIVGVPTVVSYAGAMPELAKDKEEALFYNSNDFYAAASHIDNLLQNKELAEKISKNCRERRMRENAITKVVENQIRIYKQIIETN